MKKLFLSFFLSFFFLSNFYAQTTDKNQSAPVSTEILTDGNLAYGSNCLTNKLLRTLIWGGHFNETDKDKVAAKLSSENRFRFDSRYYLSAKWTLPSQNKFGFSIGQRYFIDAGFSKLCQNFALWQRTMGESTYKSRQTEIKHATIHFFTISLLAETAQIQK